ncbi:hypothetical protein [Paraconexibacter sp. AEG42_29]|uniref:hypothetical protein n=1 Tax=Paraconexibacter sp. AEG42_29 TaxID=2997339 RepID=UPI00339D55EA
MQRRRARSSPTPVSAGDPDLRADRKDLKADAGRRLEEAVAREATLAKRAT